MKVNGVVQKVFTKVNKKTGTKFYSVCIPVDGKDTWISTGRDEPTIKEGDTVRFTALPDGDYWKVAASDIEKVSTGGSDTKKGGGGGWNSPERQQSIVAQSSITSAMKFVELALANGALVLGTAAAKAPAKFESLEQIVMKKAQELYNIGMNPDQYFDDTPPDEASDVDPDDDFNPVPE